jgi:hypothetical protein
MRLGRPSILLGLSRLPLSDVRGFRPPLFDGPAQHPKSITLGLSSLKPRDLLPDDARRRTAGKHTGHCVIKARDAQ